MAYADQQGLTTTKLIGLIAAIAIVAGIGLAMVFGLTISSVKQAVERVTTVDIEEPPPPEEEPEEPPPPEEPQPEVSPPPPVAPPPPIRIARAPPPIETTRRIPPPAPPALRIPPPAPLAPPAPRTPPPPPPPPPPSKARAASAKNQGRWARQIQDDYPSRALRQEEEGTVGVRVTVTSEGRASNCSVTRSSGSSTLDTAACRAMERYARFEPALNAAGNAIAGSFSTAITYKLN